MLLSLTRKGDYAIRAMLHITGHHPRLRNTRQIATGMDLPRNLLSQILAALVHHDLLRSTPGPAGGYVLARPPEEISLLEVIEVIEGPVAADTCVLSGGSCDWDNVCPLHESWAGARAGVAAGLATTFGDLASIDTAIREGTYRLPDSAPPHATVPERLGRD
ncbi:Rrf2 family transcriptional regulator [bacterium]|nr:Rrf2 family transcriptional regulator [bacterium]